MAFRAPTNTSPRMADAGCTGGCDSKDGAENQTNDDSFHQCNLGPFVP